jgi:hypothetical protein
VHDRPLAYRLRERIAGLLAAEDEADRDVIVCSDIWWLNNDDLRARPTVCIGGPGVNALTAYLADKLPFVFSVEGVLGVQMDLDFVDPWVTCWGVNEAGTADAVRAFEDKYVEHFVRRAIGRRG